MSVTLQSGNAHVAQAGMQQQRISNTRHVNFHNAQSRYERMRGPRARVSHTPSPPSVTPRILSSSLLSSASPLSPPPPPPSSSSSSSTLSSSLIPPFPAAVTPAVRAARDRYLCVAVATGMGPRSIASLFPRWTAPTSAAAAAAAAAAATATAHSSAAAPLSPASASLSACSA